MNSTPDSLPSTQTKSGLPCKPSMRGRLKPHHLLPTMGYSFPRHLQLAESLCLQLLTEKDWSRLVVEWPIGHGKSEWFLYTFVVWYILSFPNHRIILAFGSETLRKRYATRLMEAIATFGHLTGVSLHPTKKSIECFGLARPHQGEIYTTLPGSGVIQGLRAHLIVCDDLVPTIQEAASVKERETLTEWFWGVLMNRTMPEGTKVICVMSRRHPLDLSGSIQEMQDSLPGDKQFRTSTLEAICSGREDWPPDPLGREPGEALWPEKWPVEELQGIQKEFEDRGRGYLWFSQYQQDAMANPIVIEFQPHYFQRIFYDELPPNLPIVATCMAIDPSKGTRAASGDSTAIVVGHLDSDGCIWVEQSFLEKATIPFVVDRAVTFFQNYKPRAVGIECNGFQEEVAQRIAEEAIRRGILNFPVVKIYNLAGSGTEKSRITITLDPILSQNRMRFRRTPANERGILEFKTCPSGDHDDFPDACEMLVQTFSKVLGR